MGTPEFPFSLMRWDPLDPGHYSAGRPAGPPLWGVVHCTSNLASNESEDAYAHTRVDASAHGYFDNDDWGVQCVRTTDRAWSALYTGNLYGVHAEITGEETWTREQWLANARQSIRAAAVFLSGCARLYGWDLVQLSTGQVAALSPTGFCGHREITEAFPADHGTHTDPGPGFPWDVFMADVHGHLAAADTTQHTTTRGGDMPNGDLPVGFAIDEKDDWITTTLAVAVPLPAVGTGEGRWGNAWLYVAATDDATVRVGYYAQGQPTGPWTDLTPRLTEAVGPVPIPAGTEELLIARKRTAADDAQDAVPVRWHVQYAAA